MEAFDEIEGELPVGSESAEAPWKLSGMAQAGSRTQIIESSAQPAHYRDIQRAQGDGLVMAQPPYGTGRKDDIQSAAVASNFNNVSG